MKVWLWVCIVLYSLCMSCDLLMFVLLIISCGMLGGVGLLCFV